jgi:hypothetical protein
MNKINNYVCANVIYTNIKQLINNLLLQKFWRSTD